MPCQTEEEFHPGPKAAPLQIGRQPIAISLSRELQEISDTARTEKKRLMTVLPESKIEQTDLWPCNLDGTARILRTNLIIIQLNELGDRSSRRLFA